jgi:hypothetical protein
MKNSKLILGAMVLMTFAASIFSSCKKDDESFNLTALVAGALDLNGATSATGVDPAANIVATFSTDVDASSATASNVMLHRDYDDAMIDVNITVSGNTITVDPVDQLGDGTLYNLELGAGLKGTNGTAFVATSRTFTTAGTFVPAGEIAYWNFENNTNDQVGGRTASAAIDLTYVNSYNSGAGKAAEFNGTTTIVEFPNGDELDNTHDFSIAFWVYANSVGHVDAGGNPKGHFVFGLGAFYGFQFEIAGDYGWCKLATQYEFADGTTGAEDTWFPGDGKTKDNGGWQGWTFCKDLTGSGGVAGLLKDKWAHVVCVYNSSTREGKMYINGELMKAFDFDLWPDGDAKRGVVGLKYGGQAPDVVNEFALGFIQSRAGTLWDTEGWGGYDYPTANHFGGMLDNLRVFHAALTDTEISLMYNSEK